MLVVKVELWPGGDPSRAHELGRLAAANVSELADVSDYVCVLKDNRSHESSVLIDRHRRSDGFWALVARAAASGLTPQSMVPIDASRARLVEAIKARMMDA